MRTLAITQNITTDGSIEMLDDWFDPERPGQDIVLTGSITLGHADRGRPGRRVALVHHAVVRDASAQLGRIDFDPHVRKLARRSL